MTAKTITSAEWRARVQKELGDTPFDKALVQRTLEGLALEPLYTEAPAGAPVTPQAEFRICMQHAAGTTKEHLAADLEGGAEALWLAEDFDPKLLEGLDVSTTVIVVDAAEAPKGAVALGHDPLGRLAAGRTTDVAGELARFAAAPRTPGVTNGVVSTLPYHDAGADAADEIAFALSTGVHYLRALTGAGLSATEAAEQLLLRVAVGRDTFLELAKVRALRTCFGKVLAASGASARPRIHAVASSRTLTARDPWVNLLRVTTQLFAAILGGADLVTPAPFDAALGSPSVLARRVARNTGLVLREESWLGKVSDAPAGSYYLDTTTDALAREAWARFRTLEAEGGILHALQNHSLHARLEATWRTRLAAVAKRKTAILGVSDFANLGEQLPEAGTRPAAAPLPGALPVHRDAEAFEALRDRAEQKRTKPEAVLVTLGTLAETRGRVGFASGLFAAGGIASREATTAAATPLACLCGPDERYLESAVARARELKAAGVKRLLLAGRPGAQEADLRAAGVDGFVFVGCDALATLTELLEDFS